MNKQQLSTSPELQSALLSLRWQLRRCCEMFVNNDGVKQEIGSDAASTLSSLLVSEEGLMRFRSMLRTQLIECERKDPRFDSSRYWDLIGAIAFWENSHEGRLHYSPERLRQRWLGWSEKFVGDVVQTLH